MDNIISTLLYPGAAFVIVYSFLLQGISRKIVARMQNRVGPPILQPFYDIIKLLSKESVHFRHSSHMMWIMVAFVSAFSVALVTPSVLDENNILYGGANLILVVYFISLSYLALMFGGVASRSVYSEIGGARGMVQFISFEVVFLLTTLVPAMKLGSFNLLEIASTDSHLLLGMPLFAFAFLLSILPQVHMQPFNIPNAHQEIVAGYATEFSGVSYAMVEMTHWFKLFALISLFGTLYLGGIESFVHFFIYSIAVLLLLLIMRAAIARTRIQTAARFYFAIALMLLADMVVRNV